MNEQTSNKRLTCSICNKPVLKKIGESDKRYAVRTEAPVICNVCSQDLAETDKSNQDKKILKCYSSLVRKNDSRNSTLSNRNNNVVQLFVN